MKTLSLFSGLSAAVAITLISYSQISTYRTVQSSGLKPEYRWTQVAPAGSGTHQHEWVEGTYPSALVPVKGWKDELWMVGQKQVWSSQDGIQWRAFRKPDWGERISMAEAFFNNALWISGGMEYKTNTFLNELWTSKDGRTWSRPVQHASWSPRKGHTLVAFHGKLWLFGGEVSVDEYRVPKDLINDIWTSDDGIHWTQVAVEAPWQVRANPRVLVFQDKLWLIGGQGRSDIWNSDDGVEWTQMKESSPWKNRHDYGALVFDSCVWVFGGRTDDPRNAYKDVWFSRDGVDWQMKTDQAPWTPRSGGFSIVLGDRLLLYGGKHTGHKDSFSGDIWTMERLSK